MTISMNMTIEALQELLEKKIRAEYEERLKKAVEEWNKANAQARDASKNTDNWRNIAKHWRTASDRWEGKYHAVCRENNALRRKLYPPKAKVKEGE